MKCVIVVNEALPVGIIANTSAVLALSIGKRFPEIVGPDVADADGQVHAGITQLPVPILKGSHERLADLRNRAAQAGSTEIFAVDVSDVAQRSKHYAEYGESLSQTLGADLKYFGIGLVGPQAALSKLTGSLPLFR